jgi:Lrp/AsnC family transcriptional regulator for asnA, asnC and gidA
MLDGLDNEIITRLQINGRESNTDVARALGVSEGTIRKRIERLLAAEVIQIGAWADPLKVGYQTYAFIQIKVTPGMIEQAAAELARLPEIYFLGICTGEFDLLAGVLIRSNDHMCEFVVHRLARVPGLVSTATSSILKIAKRDFAYPVGAATAGEAGREADTEREPGAGTSSMPSRAVKGGAHDGV